MKSTGYALPVSLLLALATLCGLIWSELNGMSQHQAQDTPARVPMPVQPAAAGSTELPNQRDAWFKEIVARPLFSPDRRPTAQTDTRDVRGLPRLTGIVTNGSRRVAIFAGPSGGHPTVVEVGSRLGSYEVRDVEESGVTIAGPEGVTVVHPVFDSGPAPAKPTLPARPDIPKPTPR